MGKQNLYSTLTNVVPAGVSAAVSFGAALTVATPAAAAPLSPVAGNQSAAATIDELEAQGYTVAINWTNGYSGESLRSCSASSVHNPDRSFQGPAPENTTVYVDVSCPHLLNN